MREGDDVPKSSCSIVRIALDSCMTRFSKSLSLSDYESTLDIVWEGLCDKHFALDKLSDLVHLSSILMHDSPEGT